MFVGNKQLNTTSEIGKIKSDKDEINRVNETKYLGLTINKILFWTQQCRKIIKGKRNGGLNSIRKFREILLRTELFLVYQALVESHLR